MTYNCVSQLLLEKHIMIRTDRLVMLMVWAATEIIMFWLQSFDRQNIGGNKILWVIFDCVICWENSEIFRETLKVQLQKIQIVRRLFRVPHYFLSFMLQCVCCWCETFQSVSTHKTFDMTSVYIQISIGVHRKTKKWRKLQNT